MIPGVSLAGWKDAAGNLWRRGRMTPAGWLLSETLPGTICFERGRFACYRLLCQTEPCASFHTIHDAAAFMVRERA